MKNYKNLYVVIIVLILGLITCIYLLIKEKQRKNIILETTQFLSILTKDVYNDIDSRFDKYDFFYKWIKEDIDSFNIYAKQEPFYNSDEFKGYLKEHVIYDVEINEQLFSLFNSVNNIQSIEFDFLKELINFVFITCRERQAINNFCLFDDVGVRVSSKKDTIAKGEEYFAYIGYSPSFYQTIPLMIIDGDTVPTIRDTQVFKETPQKSGKIKHECMITYNWQGHIIEMPFTIEYYVK
ncbi:MAG TPA: hypothetical protein PLL02_04870 [Bacteroidales bacterium]|nr:hypothetical protein [Bacteroidales bacterium]